MGFFSHPSSYCLRRNPYGLLGNLFLTTAIVKRKNQEGRSLMSELWEIRVLAEFGGKGEGWEESWNWYGQVRKGSQSEAEVSLGCYLGEIIPLNLRKGRSGTSGCLSMRSKQVSQLRLPIWIGARKRVIGELFHRNYSGAKKQSTAGPLMPVAKNIEPSD